VSGAVLSLNGPVSGPDPVRARGKLVAR